MPSQRVRLPYPAGTGRSVRRTPAGGWARPAGADGWSEDRLAGLVTRDSMIGTGLALEPAA